MKIELASAHQILVELNRDDLLLFHLTVEQLGVVSDGTQQVLQRVLCAAAEKTGRTYQLQTTARVDVLPDNAGGCLLIVSGCSSNRTVPPEDGWFYTAHIDHLIDCARAVCKGGENPLVTLLQTPDGFLLYASCLQSTQQRLFAEFLQPAKLSEPATRLLFERYPALLQHAPLSVLGGGS